MGLPLPFICKKTAKCLDKNACRCYTKFVKCDDQKQVRKQILAESCRKVQDSKGKFAEYIL